MIWMAVSKRLLPAKSYRSRLHQVSEQQTVEARFGICGGQQMPNSYVSSGLDLPLEMCRTQLREYPSTSWRRATVHGLEHEIHGRTHGAVYSIVSALLPLLGSCNEPSCGTSAACFSCSWMRVVTCEHKDGS